MKNLILWLVVLSAIMNPLFAEELYVSGLGDSPVWNKYQTAQVKVFGCYIRNRDKALAQTRAEAMAKQLSVFGAEVKFVGIEKNKNGQVKIVYSFEPTIVAKSSSFGEDLFNKSLTFLPLKNANQTTKLIVWIVLIILGIFLLISIIKRINRARLSWKTTRAKRRDNRRKLRSLRQDAKHRIKEEKIAVEERQAKRKIIEAEEQAKKAEAKRKADRALEDREEKLQQEQIELNLKIKEYELVATKKTFQAKQQAERIKQAKGLLIWSKTMAEIIALQAKEGFSEDEARICPYCIADLQAMADSGAITEEQMFERVNKLAPVKFKNIPKHYGEKHNVHVKQEATEINFALANN